MSLGWVHWPSALLGVVLFYVLGFGFVLAGTLLYQVREWFARRASQETEPVEEVRTYQPGRVTLPRRRRAPDLYFPVAPRIPSARHSTVLSPQESATLWHAVNGERA